MGCSRSSSASFILVIITKNNSHSSAWMCVHTSLWCNAGDGCTFLRDMLISAMLYTTHTVLSNALWNLSLLSETIPSFKGSQVLMIFLKCEHVLTELLGYYKTCLNSTVGDFFHAFSRYFVIIIPQIHHQWNVTKVLVVALISSSLPFFSGL